MRKLLRVVLMVLFVGLLAAPVLAVDTYTQTKYPIVMVPGVLGYDTVLGINDYFYGMQNAIQSSSNRQKTHLISIAAWQQTETRGLNLKNAIETLCIANGYSKVNIIAHSHGATTSRVAMYLNPARVASLTTVAGPHYGTPFADYAAKLPSWAVKALVATLNLAGDALAVLSHHCEWLGQQDALSVLNDFTQQGIKQFNTKYPCAGVPAGGSYGKLKYGSDAASTWAQAGDGRAAAMSTTDPTSILYYSFSGNVGDGWLTNVFDFEDYFLGAIHLFNNLEGYHGDADAFIPTTSARFGYVISTSYYWNHVDEQNQFMGLRALFSADPLTVYRAHANRLKLAGR